MPRSLPGAVRPGLDRRRALLPHLRRPRGRADDPADGPGEPPELVGPGAAARCWPRRGYFVITLDNRDVGRSTKVPGRVTRGDAGARLRRLPRPRAVLPDRHGRATRSHCSTTSASSRAHVVGRVDGRDDRPDDGDRGARPGALADQHHVDDRQAHGRLAAPAAASPRCCGPIHPGREAYADSSVAMWRLIGSPGYPRPEERTRAVAERDLRPRAVGERLAAADDGDPDPAEPLRAAARRPGADRW